MVATAKKAKKSLDLSSREKVLAALEAGEIDAKRAGEEMARLDGSKELYCKVSEKGCVSVYGLQRMPISLYPEQWQRLLNETHITMVLGFIETNRDKLSWKGKKK
jgi:hypothetical protein